MSESSKEELIKGAKEKLEQGKLLSSEERWSGVFDELGDDNPTVGSEEEVDHLEEEASR